MASWKSGMGGRRHSWWVEANTGAGRARIHEKNRKKEKNEVYEPR